MQTNATGIVEKNGADELVIKSNPSNKVMCEILSIKGV